MSTQTPKASALSGNTIPTNEQQERAALGDVSGDARESARTVHGDKRGEEGTPPSNTVPSNDNTDKFKVLRFGVDSLYLSYRGKLADDWNFKLDELKTKAQSEDEAEQALAQVAINSHIFEVRDKGVPRFPYVLVDNCFYIKINRKQSHTLPMAHVQISSEYLAAVGLEAAEMDLRIVINTLGQVEGEASVSRADLFLDFSCADNLAKIEQGDWVTRANLMAKYFDCRLEEPFTGWVIGMGGNLHARLYEKVVEIVNKSHKVYLFELWKANGWQLGDKVWRMEFQTEKQTLKELDILTLSDLLKHQAALWHYLTHDWLRLSIPNPNDSKRDRWPNHPLWDAIADVYALPIDQPRLQRFRPARLPADDRLFVHGLGGLTSFMASRGIEDFGEGLGEYLHQATQFHASKGEPFHSYVERKVKAKNRKYNTINNQKNMVGASRRLQEEADAYQREKDGDDGDA
ncbi:MAG: hypothetical protein EPO42_11710 [Gallionellaceae bacterium]|nr:MAG: hypothetical protein EPO42_11710 [Gallionellaceae bacterium]